jgi:hypothetical protein
MPHNTTALAARHAATTSTLHTQLASAQGALATEQLAHVRRRHRRRDGRAHTEPIFAQARRPCARRRGAQTRRARALPCTTCTGAVLVLGLAVVVIVIVVVAPYHARIVDLARRGPVRLCEWCRRWWWWCRHRVFFAPCESRRPRSAPSSRCPARAARPRPRPQVRRARWPHCSNSCAFRCPRCTIRWRHCRRLCEPGRGRGHRQGCMIHAWSWDARERGWGWGESQGVGRWARAEIDWAR